MNPQLIDILKLAWPLILIQFGLQIWAIIDIIVRKKTKTLSPALWVIIVIFGEILGSILYIIFGRSEE